MKAPRVFKVKLGSKVFRGCKASKASQDRKVLLAKMVNVGLRVL